MRVNIGRNCPPLLKWCFFLFGSGFLLSCGNDNAQDPIAGKAPTAIIMASSSTASVNSAVTISWESTNSNTCIASGAWSGSKPTSGSESFTLVSAAPYNFKLNCYSTDSIINSSSTTASTTVSGYQVWDFVQRGLDLDGEAANDMSGHSVSLSSDGSVVAIGALYNDGNNTISWSNNGHARVYAWNGTTWAQRGNDLDGEAVNDNNGYSVSLSNDGSVVAIGAPKNDGNGSNSGHTRIYAWNGTAWIQRGEDIDGEAAGDYSGRSVSLSSDGTVVAIGAYGNQANGNFSGHTRVYVFDGHTAWIKKGQDLDGEAANDMNGNSVSLSNDGNVVAIGADRNDANGSDSGHTRIYAWNGTTWAQRGDDLDGEAAGDNSGYSVSLSNDGSVVAIGARKNDGNGSDSGHTRIYAWNGATWIQRGDDIDGEAADDYNGMSVSLSSDGSVVAIAAPANDENGRSSGHTRIYTWNGTAWTKRGDDLDGEAVDDFSGWSVSLSDDGTVVAIGALYNDGNGSNSGHTRVYVWQ